MRKCTSSGKRISDIQEEEGMLVKQFKRWISLILVFCLLLPIIPAEVLASPIEESEEPSESQVFFSTISMYSFLSASDDFSDFIICKYPIIDVNGVLKS